MTLHAGMELREGRYSIQRPLGKGGMGSTYLAEDLNLGRKCVIKEPHISDASNRERARQEARLLAALPKHPNLPIVYEWFLEHERPYIVMEYVEGMTLEHLAQTRDKPFEVQEVLKWLKDLLGALKLIHQHGILHRDIKPQNVCITPSGNAILLDFGISRRMDDTRTKTLDQAVSQGYAPIEQYPEEALKHMPSPLKYVQNLHKEGIRTGPYSDLYSLSATMYFALTYHSPPDACMRVLEDELRSLKMVNSLVSDSLSEWLTQNLSLHPLSRYQSVDEALKAIPANPGMPLHTELVIDQSHTPLRTYLYVGLALILIIVTVLALWNPGKIFPILSTSTPFPTNTPAPTLTPTPTTTFTPTATSTITPTPSPTFTPTPTESVELCEGIIQSGSRYYYVYPRPDRASGQIGIVPAQKWVDILDQTRDKDGKLWYKIDYGSDAITQQGWIPAEYVIEDNDCPTLP